MNNASTSWMNWILQKISGHCGEAVLTPMIQEQEFFEQLQRAIAENRITLPTLPEVALRVRDAVGQNNATAKSISNIVVTDVALSARLLQVANSPLYRGRNQIDNIQMAVTRLGNRLVRSLVQSLIMQQIFQATSDVLDRRFRRLWENSVEVSAVSRVLAQQIPHLEPDQAMLGGLIHEIGALPILVMAEGVQELVEDEQTLDRFIERLSPLIGQQILETWEFPETLVKIPGNCKDLSYESGPMADYVDVVLVARLQTLAGTKHPHAQVDWSEIPSFAKVGIEPEVLVVDVEGTAEEINSVKDVLNQSETPPSVRSASA